MGVIDLYKKVRILEENAGNSEVLDQLAAEVTALENEVNGDGETDLGIVGDIAALQAAVAGAVSIEDVSSKFTKNASVTFTGSPTVTMIKIGNVVFGHFVATVSGGYSGAGNPTTLGNIDSSIRPASNIVTICLGENRYMCDGYVKSNGDIQGYGGTYHRFDAFWVIPTT